MHKKVLYFIEERKCTKEAWLGPFRKEFVLSQGEEAITVVVVVVLAAADDCRKKTQVPTYCLPSC